jgi:hypothetical protein
MAKAKTQKEKEQRKEVVKGWMFFLSGVALAVKLLVASIWNIHIPWDSIDMGINVLLSLAGSFGAFRNNYISKIGIKQYHLLKNSDLQHFFRKWTKED